MRKITMIVLACTFLIVTSLSAQPENWFNLDPEDDKVLGISTERMYEKLIQGKIGKVVIVAVLDSGVDPKHKELKEIMWVNADEIPNNGLDDDKNGYIDDIHGWNFLGNAKGENVHHDNLEMTRIYRKLKPKYENADSTKLTKKQLVEFRLYHQLAKDLEINREKYKDATFLEPFYKALVSLKELIGKENISKEDIEGFETDDPLVARTANVALQLIEQGYTLDGIIEEVEEQFDYYNARLNFMYNPDFDPRSIIGDDYDNPNDRNYGNNDVKGPDAFHGTAVAGAIAANRNNGTDVKGVANNVRIMAVRVVPDGDERDKDVANAIRYAVDNGASIINMSFGKGYSWDKKAVDKAVKYAAKKDVLLVHAAGNDGKENFPNNNFPNDQYEKKGFLGMGKKYADNWIEVGALSWETGENMAASFSNYSKQNVDVFAPGVRMKLPIQDDKYRVMDGTSFAAPVVSGVAAMLRSYFPSLTAKQVKEIIMESSIRPKGTVIQPGSDELVPFNDLSVSGGMVNVFNAMIKANEIQGKKKNKATIEKAIP